MEELQGGPRVTALVVSRNNEALLRRCLQALEASRDRARLEILTVDDGSEDGSADVPDEFPGVISLRIPKRVGWARAVNIALRTAKGDMVLLMTPDVRVKPETIGRLAERLESARDTGAVCPYVERTYPFPSAADLAIAWKTGELRGGVSLEPRSGDVETDYPQGAPVLVRRELLRAMNYLDRRFGHHWPDLEMFSRIRGGGKKVVVMTDVEVERDDEASNSTELDWVDSAHGAATWVGLHHGFLAGLQFRVAAALGTLVRGQFSSFFGILTGQKIDGNQP
jgi:GT2 family glycosyltransferase